MNDKIDIEDSSVLAGDHSSGDHRSQALTDHVSLATLRVGFPADWEEQKKFLRIEQVREDSTAVCISGRIFRNGPKSHRDYSVDMVHSFS